MVRVFIAILLPLDVRRSLSLLQIPLKGAQWTSVENYHLTVRFIGEQNESKIYKIRQVLRDISYFPFNIKLRSLGHFSSTLSPKVIWVGISPTKEISDLRVEVDQALLEIDIPLEKKNFLPHVTLAKLKNTSFGSTAQYLKTFMAFESREVQVSEMALLSSKIKNGKVMYSTEDIFTF